MNFKNFFLNKFNEFLATEEIFFKKYKKIYLINFLQLMKKKYPQTKITLEIKNLISDFYEALFINPSLKTGNFKPLILMREFLLNNGVEYSFLNKTFLLMANHYIKHIFPSSDLAKLKTLTLLLDFYQKFIFQFKEDKNNEKLPKIIKNIYENKFPFILFGVYKGIPISNKTQILSINDKNGFIKIRANEYQLIASKFQKEIYLLDAKTNKTFKAFVKDSIMFEKSLILSDIKEIKRNALKRNYIRVQPKQQLSAIMIYDNKQFTGKIYDLSIKGISIISQKSLPFNINDTLTIKFKLPINENEFEFLSELKSISKFDENYRYHFYFEPTPAEESELEKYITKREKEIVSELTNYLNKEFIEF